MLNQEEVITIVDRLCHGVGDVFPRDRIEAILFGSYARGNAEFGSDIDVLLLVDSSRDTIAQRSWQIGSLASELLMSYGIVVSPLVENRDYFNANSEVLPFFRNIKREGVRLSA